MRVLVIEDQAELREALQRRLGARGDVVHGARDLAEAEAWLAPNEAPFDVVVLDRGLPDGDGIDALARWRARGMNQPVLVLTAQREVADRVEGLGAGADDYLGKPFAMAELLARVTALGRRGERLPLTAERVGNLELDRGRREARREGVLIPLRAKEYAVLEFLLRRRGRLVSRGQLREHCWGESAASSNVEERTIASLRHKLGLPALIHTRRGEGYILEEEDE